MKCYIKDYNSFTKFNKLLLLAEDENISVGDLIFEKMIECQSSENDFFNEMCS